MAGVIVNDSSRIKKYIYNQVGKRFCVGKNLTKVFDIAVEWNSTTILDGMYR